MAAQMSSSKLQVRTIITVEGTGLELDEDTHAQAGKILKALHSQDLRVNDEYETATAKALSWLDREHRIHAEVECQVRRRLAEYRPRHREVVRHTGTGSPGTGSAMEGRSGQ